MGRSLLCRVSASSGVKEVQGDRLEPVPVLHWLAPWLTTQGRQGHG